MKEVYRIDADGYYVEPVNVQGETPADCVEVAPPNMLFNPRFVEGEWVQGMTQEEIEELKIVPLSPFEEMKKQQTDLVYELMMKGLL